MKNAARTTSNRLWKTTIGLGSGAIACLSLQAAEETTAQAPKPAPTWKTSAALGVTLTRGNSDTVTVNGTLDTVRKWAQNEASAGFSVTYGESDGTETANNMAAYGQFNRLFSDRFFVYGRGDFLRDNLADIDYRIALSPGAGYYFLKDNKFTLSGEVGPGYIWEKVGTTTSDYWSLHLAERFTWTINERARLWQSLGYDPEVGDFGNYVVKFEVGVETDILENLSMRVVGIDTYRSEPAAGRVKNDFQLITGIVYKF